MGRVLKLLLVLFVLILVSCAQVEDPLTGQKTLTLLPTEKEIEIGKKYIPYAINENEGLYPDKEVQEYLRRLGHNIARTTPRKVEYQFFIVNSKDVNAFALPGGPVFINRGLMLTLDNESELVGVLSHELGHINARHHARFLEKTYGLSLLLNVLAVATAESSYRNMVLQVAQVGASLLQLKFSRDQENEADSLGVRFTYESGYDPRGIISVFNKFKSMEAKQRPPEWLLTHPLPNTRIKNVSELINRKFPDRLLLKRDSPEFVYIKRKIANTALSYDYLEKAKENIKNRDFRSAQKNLDTAISLYEENTVAHTYKSFICYQLKEYDCSYRHALNASKVDGSYFLPKLLTGISLVKLNRNFEAIKQLEDAATLINSNPDLYYFLGVAYQNTGNRQKAIENFRLALSITDGNRGWESEAKERLNFLSR